MTLKSAQEDLQQSTLSALSGLLARLIYLGSLRGENGRYEHWGMKSIYGAETAERAIRTAHAEIVAALLKTPLAVLEEDVEVSRAASAISAPVYVKHMRDHFEDLMPAGHVDGPSAAHLNSVLAALLSLKRHPSSANRSAS